MDTLISAIFWRIIFFIAGLILLCTLVYNIFMETIIPNIIEKRYKALDLMQYDGKDDKFVPKSDSLLVNKWDLWYIQYGTTKGKGY